MNWKDLFNELADAFKVPETKKEAIEWINNDANSQTLIEEMAFRQVVVNVLVAANIISEKDFNASIAHFKKLFTERFAEELLDKIEEFNKQYGQLQADDDKEDDDEFEWLDENDERVGKA